MKLNQRSSIFVILLALYGLFAIHTAGAQPISHFKLDSHRIPWSHLSYNAKNFWVEVSTDIHLRSITASELDTILLKSPKGTPIQPLTPKAAQMIINTTIDPRFRSPVNINNHIWFNPTDAAALGRIRLRRGEDDFKKMYRFTEKGVFRHRREPKNRKEASLAPEKWTDVKDSFYPYDLTRLDCPVVTERSLLIYILSAVDFSKIYNPISLCVFGKRQLHRVRLQKPSIHQLTVNYLEKKQQSELRKQITVKTLKIEIEAKPMKSDLKEPENFSFLGVHKNISVFIDPISLLPLQAGGIIPGVGYVNLKLREARMK